MLNIMRDVFNVNACVLQLQNNRYFYMQLQNNWYIPGVFHLFQKKFLEHAVLTFQSCYVFARD